MTAHAEGVPPQLLVFLIEHGIAADFVAPGVPMPTVLAAAAAIGVPETRILKTLLFTADDGAHVIAIANGVRRVSRALLAQASGLTRPRAASPETVFAVTGYPAGGVAPLGLPKGLPVVVDERVAMLPLAYGGGGREDLLLRLDPADLIRLNHAVVARIVIED